MNKNFFRVFHLTLSGSFASAQQYDVVLEGGRTMDPETSMDAVRNIGIRDGKIARISTEALSGRRVVHAGGLIVAPGFIDLHQHGQEPASQRVKALDGVTTALELEIGVPDVAQFLKAKEGRSLIHYGTSPSARQKGRLQEGADADIVVFDAQTISDRSTYEKPMEPSIGVRHLLVGETLVVDAGKIVPEVYPGRALRGPAKRSPAP